MRGIFLDTCTETKGIPVDRDTFTKKFKPMHLRYLKIYDSLCPEKCRAGSPEGLDFPFEEIRYLHWENIELKELPSDFNPKNLIDLRLPYNKKIDRVWGAVKVCVFLCIFHYLFFFLKKNNNLLNQNMYSPAFLLE